MLGSGGVGKTSLSLMFVRGEFVESYVPTIEDEFQKNVNIDGETYPAYIVDTAGQDEFKDLKSTSLKNCDGFFLVYAVDDANSAESLRENFDLIKNMQRNTKNVIILGNKCDLPKDTWKVKKEEVKNKIKQWGSGIPIFEVSAKAGIGVNESFEKLARILLGKDQASNQNSEGGGCCNIQ